MSIGRGEESAVRIDDLSVSRNHAVLHVGTKLMIEDLGSANGTMVRERAGQGGAGETLNVRLLVGRKAELVVGDTMLFGTASVVVRHAPHADVPDLARPADGAAAGDLAMRLCAPAGGARGSTPINVLILGETGVGKEVMARAIHAHSPRAKGPFVGINCAALPRLAARERALRPREGRVHRRDAGAAGLFEGADGGTVFLDEIGEMPPALQAKLLRVLEEQRVRRALGADRPIAIDVRFVAATNRDLEAEVGSGRFRADLYFPSQRLPAVDSAAARARRGHRARSRAASSQYAGRRSAHRCPGDLAEALRCSARYAWPGNVRELRNVIERAAVLCPGEEILPEHLPPALTKRGEPEPSPTVAPRSVPPGSSAAPTQPGAMPSGANVNLVTEIKSIERARITEALARCGGNQSKAARLLGVSRGTLIARIEEYGLARPLKGDAGATKMTDGMAINCTQWPRCRLRRSTTDDPAQPRGPDRAPFGLLPRPPDYAIVAVVGPVEVAPVGGEERHAEDRRVSRRRMPVDEPRHGAVLEVRTRESK